LEDLSLWLVLGISIGGPTLLLFVWTLVIRTFPAVLGEGILKRIQFRYDVELEQNKAKHQERLATGTSSVDFLSSVQSDLRLKTIESAEILWKAILTVKKEFSDLVFLLSILNPDEFVSLFHKDDSGPLATVENYRDIKYTTDKIEHISSSQVEETRLFVGDRLWYLFFVLRAFHGRLGYLFYKSFGKNEYFDWRNDHVILGQLRQVLDDSAIEEAGQDPFSGVPTIVSHLESEFLREATRVMSGSQALADSLYDIQATLAYGAQMARESSELRKV